ncbi:helix-turn-helix domain-containing protein [Kocuria sp. SL71]|uniref:helix-turn-helix domain-containing protein n=1 Tax=Kocuria sp. SL71 TaxID=2995151 RepID=UPI002273460E|nr:LysR family transcriptional regulator [Kocuria sp. SL71]MCY1683281.1 LysR family transcriptional regulator [Kocuria sp. SL71]
MNVEIRHLRAVTALAEAESFTVTAAMLGTTQLTLSRTLTQLEEILEIRLVARTTWEHSLTPAVCATAPTATAPLRDGADSTPRTIRVANTDEWLTRIAVGGAVGITAEATTHDYQSPREGLSQLEVQSARSTVEAARAQLLGADQLRICGFNGTGASAVVDAALAQPIGVDDSRICGLGNAGRWELSSARDGGGAGTPSTGTTTGS